MPSVLFVCTGNICRSPMAAALFKRLVRPGSSDANWQIESAGTRAIAGFPASTNAQEAMLARGLDIRTHRSRRVEGELAEKFDLVLTMEAAQKEMLQVEFPALAGRIFMLSEMVGEKSDVDDPIGSEIEAYDATARQIDQYLTVGFKKILRLAGTDK